ncbi:autophagy-related protein 17 [Elsinoe ampelina]|uniref:Autophagy-related protein 17 n=1 Tax=Elsinoe ampelina TaxID=302913 RepID=A0A6A6G7R8_9PEZI|nr:autophagy-related protein 17 [Elsinoe ampelina]
MSNSASPAGSLSEPPSLDRLVAYFVAAKRSLSATTHVYKANEIVEDARALVEQGGVLKAKNTYVRNGIEEQIHVLQNIHGGLESVGLEAQLDFSSIVKSLDVAHDRLQSTLNSLRKTLVSSSLGASPETGDESIHAGDSSGKGKAVQEPDKTLYDFIDEATHSDLFDSVRATIDSYNDAQSALHEVRTSLGHSLEQIDSSIFEIDTLKPNTNTALPEDETIASSFAALTHNATEMASLLQSLISHYDLCITALKHTEGGGEAARAAADSTDTNPLSSGADSPTEASLYAGATAEANRAPISEDERVEMLSVLTHDAAQVEDVVLEIRERADEMGLTLSALQSLTDVSKRRFNLLQAVLETLASLSTSLLPQCISAPLSFRDKWASIRNTMHTKIAALNELSQFYDSFLASYASLLREVERRKMVEAKQRKIAERAMRDIEALHAEDADMRNQFVKETGDWLPRDIWPGLMDAPRRFVLKREKQEDVGLGIMQEGEVQGQAGED